MTAKIVVLIDIQNGFARNDLSLAEGGSLYVPGGESVAEPAARLIRNLSNATIILSQDFHPAAHIGFVSSHAGATPLSEIRLKRNGEGSYAATRGDGTLSQTLWPEHCVQGTKSALFADPVMAELPRRLRRSLERHVPNEALRGLDERCNAFYVVRKGTRPDLDSYGIGTENDGIETTAALRVFELVAKRLSCKGFTKADIYIGGLATNYCVEFSHNDIYKYLVPELEARGIKPNVYFLTDISAGIPLAVPGGAWPDLASATDRMAAKGTRCATTDDVIRGALGTVKHTPKRYEI